MSITRDHNRKIRSKAKKSVEASKLGLWGEFRNFWPQTWLCQPKHWVLWVRESSKDLRNLLIDASSENAESVVARGNVKSSDANCLCFQDK